MSNPTADHVIATALHALETERARIDQQIIALRGAINGRAPSRRLRCPKCPRTFARPMHLGKHARSHKGGK